MRRAKNPCINSRILIIVTLLLSFTPIDSATPWRARTPCRSYLWDAPSAWRYHICKRLLRGRIYEGLGGKKFVRIKPYSVLSSLYPLSRHGPDRCLICGHSFENHLATWWFPFLYTPFDRHLGEFFEKYTSNPDECQVDAKMQETPFSQYSEPGLEPIYNQNQVNKPFRKREFHKAYVKDITNEQTDNSSRRKDPKTRQRNRARDRYEKQNKNGMNQFFQNRFETRQIVGIKYKVPTIDVSGEEYNLGSALVLALVRTMVLERFESFLVLQERDNRWHDWKMLHEM